MNTNILIRPSEMEEKAEKAADFLRALANPQRLRLVCELTSGECGVGELEERTGIRQPSLSKELGKLREAGLIEGRRESKAVFYSLVEPKAASIIAILCGQEPIAPPPVKPKARREAGSVFARILPHSER
ncbi:metalloregulator ArsR/SmtB family transcription factor [Parvularcula sp. LCG005]|uniref:ArsR/SmtB family transcription factor n=1 Tax=Parvularcula sp. LCG005 TaxID=3078805 RepID=UPI0029436C8E|nr:metalloregulator ArsR/SmtB family transcription factor [Parvularcula sp. LCG005]WOI52175.1 metalloregulator ArsR/SmtB family transcription factor [Parvularcula sp. LCG005]